MSTFRKDKDKKYHKDSNMSQGFEYQHYMPCEVFEPLCLSGRRKLIGVDSKTENSVLWKFQVSALVDQ
jgi:hypothetical protein